MAALYLFRCKTSVFFFINLFYLLSPSLSVFIPPLPFISPPLPCPLVVQSEAKEMSGVSSISLGNCDSVFSSVRLNHLPLEEWWGGPYPGPKSNLNPQRLLKPLQVISIQTRGKSTNMNKHFFCYLSCACTFRTVGINTLLQADLQKFVTVFQSKLCR